MNKYEFIGIYKENLNNEEIEKEIEKLKRQIKNIVKIKKYGFKKLAYELKKNKNGYYIGIDFEAENIEMARISKFCLNNSNILKYMILKVDCFTFEQI